MDFRFKKMTDSAVAGMIKTLHTSYSLFKSNVVSSWIERARTSRTFCSAKAANSKSLLGSSWTNSPGYRQKTRLSWCKSFPGPSFCRLSPCWSERSRPWKSHAGFCQGQHRPPRLNQQIALTQAQGSCSSPWSFWCLKQPSKDCDVVESKRKKILVDYQ